MGVRIMGVRCRKCRSTDSFFLKDDGSSECYECGSTKIVEGSLSPIVLTIAVAIAIAVVVWIIGCSEGVSSAGGYARAYRIQDSPPGYACFAIANESSVVVGGNCVRDQ